VVNQILVDKVVNKLAPKKYRPGVRYVTSITCVSSSKIRAIRQAYYSESPVPNNFIGAITLNLEVIYNTYEPEPKRFYKGKHSMFVSEDIENEEELSYIILNQLGHVDLYTRYPDKEVDSELYADFYVVNQLQKVYGKKKAVKMVRKYGSISKV
jgi:hypothetical protein